MGLQIKAQPNDTVLLSYQSPFRDETIFPQCKIYDSAGNLKATKNLTHVATGAYVATWVAPQDDATSYMAVYTPYSNSGHSSILDNESNDVDSIRVERLASEKAFRENRVFGSGKMSLSATSMQELVREVSKAIEAKKEKPNTKMIVAGISATLKTHIDKSIEKALKSRESGINEALDALNRVSKGFVGDLGKLGSKLTKSARNEIIPEMNKAFKNNTSMVSGMSKDINNSLESLKGLDGLTKSIKELSSMLEILNVNGDARSNGVIKALQLLVVKLGQAQMITNRDFNTITSALNQLALK